MVPGTAITAKGTIMISVSNQLTSPLAMIAGMLALVFISVTTGSGIAADGARSGTFQGRSDHTTTGTVTVTRTGAGATLTLGANFSLDGAPDPWIGFGNAGKYNKATQFAKLAKLKGRQTYSLPASINLDLVDEVYIYCSKFSVPLGVARIK